MHLSSAEAVLAGAAVTAVVAVGVPWGARRGDHIARLWDRRVKVYEDALALAGWAVEMQAESISSLTRAESVVVTGPDPGAGEATNLAAARRLGAQLDMLGERRVREAFGRFFETNQVFLAALGRWRDCRLANRDTSPSGIAAGVVNGHELARLKDAVRAAHSSSDVAHDELIVVVREAVVRMPRSQRAWWRHR